jgi:predicted glycosyltransferase
MSKKSMVWIDLDNSPHVPFFSPIIQELMMRGYSILLTARDCFQVKGLIKLHKLDATLIGRHYGKNKALKALGTLYRSLQLLYATYDKKPSVAVSHGSRSQSLLANILGIKCLEFDDYEFSQSVPLFKPDWIFTPAVIPDAAWNLPKSRIIKYPGIKEDIYVPNFRPDPKLLFQLGLGDEIVITIRPPATEAHYHNTQSSHLFQSVMNFLIPKARTRLVLLPRSEKQTEEVKRIWKKEYENGKVIIPAKVLDGLNMLFHSDLVISGGGTMNREAAALGVPVYTIFRGQLGAVDRYLSSSGRLTLIENEQDIHDKIVLERRDKSIKSNEQNREVFDTVLKELTKILNNM